MKSLATLVVLAAALSISFAAHAEEFRCPDGATDSGERPGMVVRWCETSQEGRLLYHGPVWRWHRNGQLAGKEYYVYGNAEGEWQSWQENGKVASRGSFESGRKIGPWKYWDAAGRLKTEVTYAVAGDLWTEYYPSGHKRATGTVRRSGKVGAWVYWNPDGTQRARCDFRDGLFTLPSAACRTIADELDPKGFSRPIPVARLTAGGKVVLKIASQAYQFTVPPGWVADTEAGKAEQVPLVLYPKDGAWRQPGPNMYLRAVFPDGRSFGGTVAREREAFEDNVAEYREEPLARGRLSNGRGYLAKKVTYKPLMSTDSPFSIVADNVIHEAVAFLDMSDQVVLMAVLACEDESQLKESTAHLMALIESLRTVSIRAEQ